VAALVHGAARLTSLATSSTPATASETKGSARDVWAGGAMVIAVVLVAVMLTGPLVTIMVSRASQFAESECPMGQQRVHVRLSPGSSLRILDESSSRSGRITVPDIRVSDLQKTAGNLAIKNDMPRFGPGNTMIDTYDIRNGRYVWLIAPTHLLTGTEGIVELCGHDSHDAQARRYGLFYAESVRAVSLH